MIIAIPCSYSLTPRQVYATTSPFSCEDLRCLFRFYRFLLGNTTADTFLQVFPSVSWVSIAMIGISMFACNHGDGHGNSQMTSDCGGLDVVASRAPLGSAANWRRRQLLPTVRQDDLVKSPNLPSPPQTAARQSRRQGFNGNYTFIRVPLNQRHFR